jgi:xanthine dehydrogenase accessory factor
MSISWVDAAQQLSKKGEAYIIATLVGVSGSTPRDSGTKMVIGSKQTYATIGGGHLEYKVIAMAHELLAENKNSQKLEHFQLGTNLGQCCGGTASVLFECFSAASVNIMLFGAGHVGKALSQILSGLPCKVTWVDSRLEQFPTQFQTSKDILGNICPVVSENPIEEVAQMPTDSYYIVMTHNHQLDFDLCQKILAREDFCYLGLIASDTKWSRFKQRFSHRDISPALVERINCPIGLSQVSGKQPMEVAVSIAAEIIECYQNRQFILSDKNKEKGTGQGVSWRDIKQLLVKDDNDALEEKKTTVAQKNSLQHEK